MSILLADPARWAPEALQRAAHRPPEAATAAIFIGARQCGTMHSGLSKAARLCGGTGGKAHGAIMRWLVAQP